MLSLKSLNNNYNRFFLTNLKPRFFKMEFVLKKCFDDPKISFGSVLRSMLRNVLAWPSPVSTQAYLSTVVKLHPRQGGVDVDHWNPGQELRN